MVIAELDIQTSIRQFAEEAIVDRDVFLVDVVVRGRQGSRVLEVYVDGDNGVSVDTLAEISRQLAYTLEAEDLVKGKYHLNVSSPGSDRALKMPRQFPQHNGRTIEIKVRSEHNQGSHDKITGKLLTTSKDAVVLSLKSGEERTILFDEIDEAHIVLPW